ncbi:MAG: pantoate--beta-alanine ligase [Lentimicrobiaceae bacterium]|jgi:pantoate--beta-alanine ligase|nr:pantoate--beta-alanine ligase [Lentimicrobiaceae bacterium]MBT3454520.1 pantoate--beta-alanine ligase [Lentimicrobiaceae bacterium]MBT4061467.1 pantoate--beta-alanine ligase [Lentimicrobiaceae bacterium]MBT4191155.1 pantoate--beta-alanine ligase [Lentimicrobiaceae bacterium]MBT4466919.1 pantoate--beta-alanine ligase [Lentimicrobiaceae bacterium]
MITFSKIVDTQTFLYQQKTNGLKIGFVPTMGALHEGHLELMRRAKQENDILVASIFVNPIQFNNKEDLKKYPRNLNRDAELLKSVGCDVLFAPDTKEMYPEGQISKSYDFGDIEHVMEGSSRPGHFNGVGVVVSRLFEICIPHNAYFGEKDFQQLAIIKKLVDIENTRVNIVPCAIVREADGLAMSSRNVRLTDHEREIAPFIYQTLKMAKSSKDTLCPKKMKAFVLENFIDKTEFNVEYFEIADDTNLQPVKQWNEEVGSLGFIAVKLGKVRLIDNIRII